jgi:hypothetical protein
MRVQDQDKWNCDLTYIWEGKPIGLDWKKNLKESLWFGELKCKLGSKVV